MCVQKHVDENEVSIDSLLATTDSFCFVFTTRQQQESNNKNNNNMVDLLERLEVLLQVEDVSYRTIDYLSPSHQQYLHQQQQQQQQDERNPNSLDLQSTFKATVASSSSSSSSQSGINEVWREKICEWSYQVIDHFDFSREVVSVSIHYLDRFLATTPVNKKLFQLVAMTALYLAIKIHEPANLTMKSMIELSRGYFSPAQMAEMEMAILRYVLLPCRCRCTKTPSKTAWYSSSSCLVPSITTTTSESFLPLEIASFWSRKSDIHWF